MYNICTILVQYLYVYQLYKYCTTIVHILYNGRCWSVPSPSISPPQNGLVSVPKSPQTISAKIHCRQKNQKSPFKPYFVFFQSVSTSFIHPKATTENEKDWKTNNWTLMQNITINQSNTTHQKRHPWVLQRFFFKKKVQVTFFLHIFAVRFEMKILKHQN